MKDETKGMKSVLLRVYSVLWRDSRMRSMDAYKGSFFSTCASSQAGGATRKGEGEELLL